jgi:anti-sigma regulatory factor (Ser/Thr protein kinase)
VNQNTIERTAKLEHLGDFREFIAACCEQHAIDAETSFALQLSADEVCANIIEHGYADMPTGQITLNIQISPKQIVIQITDTGHPFDPHNAPVPDTSAPLEERDIGGLGIFLIHTLMDAVEYRSEKNTNTLTLTKNLP